jgi:biopolymer transport protein ExbD
MAFARYREVKAATEVDLLPVMNLFVVLIPFLLISAAFYHVSVIPTTVPTQSAGTSDIAADPLAVTLTVRLEKDALHLTASHATLDAETLATLATSLPRDGQEGPSLTSALQSIKAQYPNSDTVLVVPGVGVVYKEVVGVLDAARGQETPLFPVVVLARKS